MYPLVFKNLVRLVDVLVYEGVVLGRARRADVERATTLLAAFLQLKGT